MNKEVIKAMNKKETFADRLNKWWDKYGLIILRVVLFPFWLGVIAHEKFFDWLDSKEKWNEQKSKEILDYYVPRRANWVEEDKTFYSFDNGYGWNISRAKRYLKLKDRRYWKNNVFAFGGNMRSYLINDYELEGFTKEVHDTDGGWTEITFTLIEK